MAKPAPKRDEHTYKVILLCSDALCKAFEHDPGKKVGNQCGFSMQCDASITFPNYMRRIADYSIMRLEAMIMAFKYLADLAQKVPLLFDKFTLHRLGLISMRVASKFHDDVYLDNNFWSRIGGITLTEFNTLETRFLKLLHFRLLVPVYDYDLIYRRIRIAILTKHTITIEAFASAIVRETIADFKSDVRIIHPNELADERPIEDVTEGMSQLACHIPIVDAPKAVTPTDLDTKDAECPKHEA